MIVANLLLIFSVHVLTYWGKIISDKMVHYNLFKTGKQTLF